MNYVDQLTKVRDSLQKYVDNHGDSEADSVVERVEAYDQAVEALGEAIDALEAL